MAFEKNLEQTAVQAFTADGTVLGRIALAKPWLFKTRERVVLASNTQASIEVQVKRVEDTAIFVGPIDNNIHTRLDISAYLAAESASVYAFEQTRPRFQSDEPYDTDDLEHAEEPTVAKRVVLVDEPGHYLDSAVSGGKRRLAVQVQEPLEVTTSATGAGLVTAAIVNSTVALPNTEFSVALPLGTRQFLVHARGTSLLRLAFTPGGTTGSYLTIARGCSFFQEGLDPLTAFILYLQGDVAADVIEVLSWS